MVNKKIAIIGKATDEELEQYRMLQAIRKIEALANKEKQTYKKVKAITKVNGRTLGLCPTCDHCLLYGISTCNECFQKVSWY